MTCYKKFFKRIKRLIDYLIAGVAGVQGRIHSRKLEKTLNSIYPKMSSLDSIHPRPFPIFSPVIKIEDPYLIDLSLGFVNQPSVNTQMCCSLNLIPVPSLIAQWSQNCNIPAKFHQVELATLFQLLTKLPQRIPIWLFNVYNVLPKVYSLERRTVSKGADHELELQLFVPKTSHKPIQLQIQTIQLQDNWVVNCCMKRLVNKCFQSTMSGFINHLWLGSYRIGSGCLR